MRTPPRVRHLVLPPLLAVILASAASCRDPFPPYTFDPENAVYPAFDGQRALAHAASLVAFGPRPAGSPALERSRVFLEDQLAAAGWATQRQAFLDTTPIGEIEFINLRARFPGPEGAARLWERHPQILIGSHYESKFYKEIRFVGANDGASSTAALLEMARVLAARPALASRLELVFFDGEEAFEQFTPTDGLYGSRHYARHITRRQTPSERPRAVVILDLIGERDLNIQVPRDTPAHLAEKLFAAAAELGYGNYFGTYHSPITDDHVPFANEGVPAIDIIDLDYDAWHTSRDTLDQLSAESLQITGRTALLFVEKYLLAP